MKVIIGADHAGFLLKGYLIKVLTDWHYEVEDVGTHTTESCDYPDFAQAVGDKVRWNEGFGILIDGTGIGMCIAANKIAGVRAALCSEPFSAHLAREHNDANVLCLGERVIGTNIAAATVKEFLDARFFGGRHHKRLAKIKLLEPPVKDDDPE